MHRVLELATKTPLGFVGVLQRFFGVFLCRDILRNADRAHQDALRIMVLLGLLANPSHLALDNDPMLNIIGSALKGRGPLRIHKRKIFWMDTPEKGFVGHRRSRRDPEQPVSLVGPAQFVPVHVQAPASDVGHALGAVEIGLPFGERLFHRPPRADVTHETLPPAIGENFGVDFDRK
jgi:hypothetical protein